MNKYLKYAILGFFTLSALFAGIPKLFMMGFMTETLAMIGVSPVFGAVIGLLWILAAVGVWKPRFRSWAALGTIPILAGAIGMHVTANMPWVAVLPAVILSLAVLWMDGFFSRVAA